MKDLIIDRTESTPTVEFLENGKLKIEGRSFSEDPRAFYQPLIEWCQQTDTEKIDLEIKLDYLNTSATKCMSDVIRSIDANTKISSKEVQWFFEEDDDDMLEVGQIIEENTYATSFYFHETVEL